MIESKLLAVISKYDTEIGNRHKILEELNKIYECDKLEKLALEVILSTETVWWSCITDAHIHKI